MSNRVSGSAATTQTRSQAEVEVDIATLAKRHRISPAIIREIIRQTGSAELPHLEKEIVKGKARR